MEKTKTNAVKNIYLVSRPEVDDVHAVGYDEWDSFIVVASSEEAARTTFPRGIDGNTVWCPRRKNWFWDLQVEDPNARPESRSGWITDLHTLKVVLVGMADPSLPEGKVLCASFNAG